MSSTAPPFDPAAPAPPDSATPNSGVAPFQAPAPASRRPIDAALAARLDALLPQTQCTRCGYPDCRSYADALAAGEAEANQCPPGGAEGVRRLAGVLRRPSLPLNPANGTEGPRLLAFIDESRCIGCTLCIQACPVDAIVGAPKRMHTVIEPLCTGCELCVPACPVDCILLENASGEAAGWDAWDQAHADEARTRYAAHRARLARDEREEAARLAATAARQAASAAPPATAATTAPAGEPEAVPPDPKRAAIAAALARARARLEK